MEVRNLQNKNGFCRGYCCLGTVVVKNIASVKNYQVGN
jgi:hypothetical protein